MPAPNPFGCGGPHQPVCPPDPAVTISPKLYSLEEMKAYGQACYEKGQVDERNKKLTEEL